MDGRSKQLFTRLARRAGLLPLAEHLRSHLVRFRSRRANAEFVRTHAELVLPPTRLMHDPFGSVDYAWYWESGQRAATALHGLIKSNCQRVDSSLSVLEWGCGPARVIRHLPAFNDPQLTLHASDYNAELVHWCSANLPGIEFRTNDLAPPLNYPANHFDFIYCLSVFTHLSKPMHVAWLAELQRVLRPGGCILITLHGDYYRRKMLPDELAQYDAGELVVRTGFLEGGRMYTAFHGLGFVQNEFLGKLEVLLHEGSANDIAPPQDTWLVRKR